MLEASRGSVPCGDRPRAKGSTVYAHLVEVPAARDATRDRAQAPGRSAGVRPGRGGGAARDPRRRDGGGRHHADPGARRGARARVLPHGRARSCRRPSDRRPRRERRRGRRPGRRPAGDPALLLHLVVVRGLREGRPRGGRRRRAARRERPRRPVRGAGRPPDGAHRGAGGVRAHRRPPRDRALLARRHVALHAGGRRPPQRDGQGGRVGIRRGPAAALPVGPVRERTPLVRARAEGRRRRLSRGRGRRRSVVTRGRARRRPGPDALRLRARRFSDRLTHPDRILA